MCWVKERADIVEMSIIKALKIFYLFLFMDFCAQKTVSC